MGWPPLMMTNLERLVYMANQIARNFDIRHPDEAAAATADHIAHFWDPRMRALILDHLDRGGEGLSDIVRNALRQLNRTPAQG